MTAFLLTWKESGWPHENIVRMANQCKTLGYVEEPWRIAASNMARPGDRVWVLRQGQGPKGIFGAGHITDKPAPGPAGNGKTQMMAPSRFTVFVDPRQEMLIDEAAVAAILRPNQIRAQASGYPVDDEQSAALEKLFAERQSVEENAGSHWTKEELGLIVSDYFSMLEDELAGRAYSKTQHRNSLRKRVRRSDGSVERKHQNISAILEELGLPWINGYKPLHNFQDALVDAVSSQLESKISGLTEVVASVPPPIKISGVLVEPPPRRSESSRQEVARIVRKFDVAARDAANGALGQAGENFVLRFEQARLEAVGRKELAARVTWVADRIGDGLGYDIESFDEDGNQLYIEVKTTNGSISTPFFITENERRVAAEKKSAFRIYRVFEFAANPKIYSLPGPLETVVSLEPIVYRARAG